MTVLRWIMGVLVLVLGSTSIASFGIFIGTGIDLWMKRARLFRRWASAAALLWFNIEIWRHVVLIIINW